MLDFSMGACNLCKIARRGNGVRSGKPIVNAKLGAACYLLSPALKLHALPLCPENDLFRGASQCISNVLAKKGPVQ